LVVWWGGGDGDEVAVYVACFVFFDSRFSDHFSNLLRFAGLLLSRWRFPNLLRFAGFYVSGLPSSASASAVLSSAGVLFLWCLFRHYRPHGGASVVAETCLFGFSFYFCLVSGSPDGAGSGFWWAERFCFEFGS
jgi:hypothetical protein